MPQLDLGLLIAARGLRRVPRLPRLQQGVRRRRAGRHRPLVRRHRDEVAASGRRALPPTTEIGAGLLFAAGLITPFAGAGIIGLMIVAIVVAHWKVGFFIFKPDQGWEYCASIAVVAFAVVDDRRRPLVAGQRARHRVPRLVGRRRSPASLGIGGALAQLALSYRPKAIHVNIPYADEPTTAPRTRTPVKIVIVLCCAIVASMWVYYFVFATDEGVYQVQDKSWRAAAAEVCTAASAEREALADTSGGYIANPTNEQMLQRADIVDSGHRHPRPDGHRPRAIPVDNDKDATRVEFFVENYRIVLADRRRYTAGLREFKLEPYTETAVGGGPVSNVVLDFTAGVKGNDIPECSPPGELGGDVQV